MVSHVDKTGCIYVFRSRGGMCVTIIKELEAMNLRESKGYIEGLWRKIMQLYFNLTNTNIEN